MVAERLHANLTARTDHDIGVRSATVPCGDDLEGVAACFGTMTRAELSREGLTTGRFPFVHSLDFTAQDFRVLCRGLPPVMVAIRAE
jgi:hypothetical protein